MDDQNQLSEPYSDGDTGSEHESLWGPYHVSSLVHGEASDGELFYIVAVYIFSYQECSTQRPSGCRI